MKDKRTLVKTICERETDNKKKKQKEINEDFSVNLKQQTTETPKSKRPTRDP